MKTYLECIPCFFKQALSAARMACKDEMIHRHVLNSVSLMIPDLTLDATPPEIAQKVYRIVHEITGNADPFHEAKNRSNELAMSIYPRMKNIVAQSTETLKTACQLAIAGNNIDMGAQVDYENMDKMLEDALKFRIDQSNYLKFKNNIENASLVLYIGDNAGEVVFDRLLIEELRRVYNKNIVFVVRDKPIINDATITDAINVGLDKVARIISSGSDAPGTILSQCSKELLCFYQAADMIISKGQGNYESLNQMSENIFFMFKVKCPVIARDSGCNIGDFVLNRSKQSLN